MLRNFISLVDASKNRIRIWIFKKFLISHSSKHFFKRTIWQNRYYSFRICKYSKYGSPFIIIHSLLRSYLHVFSLKYGYLHKILDIIALSIIIFHLSNAYRTVLWRVAHCCLFCVLLILFWSLVKGADDPKVEWENKRGTFEKFTYKRSECNQPTVMTVCEEFLLATRTIWIKQLKQYAHELWLFQVSMYHTSSYRFNPMLMHLWIAFAVYWQTHI